MVYLTIAVVSNYQHAKVLARESADCFNTGSPSGFPKEPLIQSQEWSARDFVSNRSVGGKDPLSAAADLFRGSLGVLAGFLVALTILFVLS